MVSFNEKAEKMKISKLITEKSADIIAESNIANGNEYVYIDDTGNIGRCEKNHTPVGSFNIIGRPANENAVAAVAAHYANMEASM